MCVRAFVMSLMFVAMALGQPAVGEDPPGTRRGCFDEYKALVTDCNRTFSGQAERQACYDGAKIVLQDCLDRLRPRRAQLGAQLTGVFASISNLDGRTLVASYLTPAGALVDATSVYDPQAGVLAIVPPDVYAQTLLIVAIDGDDPDGIDDVLAIALPTCPADLDDGSSSGAPDGGVDINDLLFFLAQYESGAVAADLDDGSAMGTPDGGVDINDLLFFLAHYEAGC